MSTVNRNSLLRVIALEIDKDGAVSRKNMAIDRESQLENTLLMADYPAIRVATIDIPQQQLDQYQQSMIEHSLGKKIGCEGVEYCLVGASASAKNGKYYAVDAAHAKLIAKRFRFWPEAAMTYFGILVSPCKVCIEVPDARVLVVKDRELARTTAADGFAAHYSSAWDYRAAASTSSACPSMALRPKAASK